MEKLKVKNYSNSKKSIKIEHPLQLEDHFIGFDIHDDLLDVLEKKKHFVKLEIDKERNIRLEPNEASNSSPVVNNNHINTRNKTKSSRSSPETNVVEHNRKRPKRNQNESETIESLASNIQHSLELTTPTFNLTSTPKARRSVGRKVNIDINDPIFKLPFEHGWKRELVYRTSSDSTLANRANRNGDVYYYSPNNRKLRSLREIQEQLNLSLIDNNPLTIESFTFLKQPIGINDKSKELIRDANSKLSKEDSFVGITVRKSKTPIRTPYDYELSDNENNKSSNKMKIVFKNVKRSRSRSKKDKSNLEALSSTPEYVSEDWQAIQSSTVSKASPSKTVDVSSTTTSNKKPKRLSTSDGEVVMQAPCGIRCPNSDEPATLMCAQCLVYYHPACVNLNANLKIVGYVCINCRSSVRQRNRRPQSSHTVIIGASEPEQLRVEPIRIRQVYQASDTPPNFFIDKTPISKNEEEPFEIDESNSVINTVICQGNVYKTSMVEGNFHEQYVYEMKQTRGPSLMTCVVQEPNNLDDALEVNGSLREMPASVATMQSFNYMVNAMTHVFKHLKIHELLAASRVCSAWNLIAMNKNLWQNIRLKNSLVHDWNRFIDTLNGQGTVSLDMRRMLIPTKNEEFESFWLRFSIAIKRAHRLKNMELYRCPPHVIEDIIYSLPQIEVLNATSIKNPLLKDVKTLSEFMHLNLGYLGQMTKLTELRVKGLTGMKLSPMPSFENLVNLKVLSITSIKAFPKDICRSFDTLPTGLEILEIGDTDCLSKEFALSLKKLVNLTSLRLENCVGRWEMFAVDIFEAIRSLNNLTNLELINIEFSSCVENELEKCQTIKALLIIPAYVSQSATTNCHLLDCLKTLSKTLTHLVWGLTHELLRVTELFITQYQQKQLSIGYHLELSQSSTDITNNIPILRIRKPKWRPGEESTTKSTTKSTTSDLVKDSSDNNVDILSVPALEKLLETIFLNAKTKVIKVPFTATTRVYLTDHFNDLITNIKT